MRRLLAWLGLDGDCAELEDANTRAFLAARDLDLVRERLIKEANVHRQTQLRLSLARREIAGLRRLCLAYDALIPKEEAERFARVIDEIEVAMGQLRDDEAA